MRNDRDLQDLDDLEEPEHEITLGTSTVLMIFLALALLCAAFFGFGYHMGHRAARPLEEKNAAADNEPGFNDFKSQPAAANTPAETTPASAATQPSPAAPTTPTTAPIKAVTTPPPAPKTPPRRETATVPVSTPAPTPHPAAPALPAVSPTGHIMVQVSAVTRRSDADALLAALSRKGYHAMIRQGANDPLFHVQLGPYATRADAETVRKRLGVDGYNAILK